MACRHLRFFFWCSILTVILAEARAVAESDLRIPLPARSKPTPVQKFNQDGVKAIQKHQYDKAKECFYHAYLLDPDDPFTLNNLGYISELQGDVDRAQRYYELAEQNSSPALVSNSNVPLMKGKSLAEVVSGLKDRNLEANRINVEAIRLLSHDRIREAEALLEKALAQNPRDPFTLNNLGFAKENEGELKDALEYYQEAAQLNSKDLVIVSVTPGWRGRPISEIAARNATAVESELTRRETVAQEVARLNLRGVSALNRNEPEAARRYFEQAYKLNSENAFTLNNMGYVAELKGDRETADEFYARARRAAHNNDKVTLSTQSQMQGLRLNAVAGINDQQVENKIESTAEARRRMGGPIQLKRRNGTLVSEPAAVPQPPPGSEAPLPPESPPPVQPKEQPASQPASPYSPQPPKLPPLQLPEIEPQPPPQR